MGVRVYRCYTDLYDVQRAIIPIFVGEEHYPGECFYFSTLGNEARSGDLQRLKDHILRSWALPEASKTNIQFVLLPDD